MTLASEVDIAVAWITSQDLVEDIVKFAGVPGNRVRVIAGVHDFLTSPSALRSLHANRLVKIGVPRSGEKFHVKLYLFKLKSHRVCWVGSANLTDAGFSKNIELIHEHEDDGMGADWFQREWHSFNHPDEQWLVDYELMCVAQSGKVQQKPQMHAPVELGHPLDSWHAFVGALVSADEQWIEKSEGNHGVFSGKNTYLGVIRNAQPLFNVGWESLSKDDARVLLGLPGEGGVDYGLLGSMKGAGVAKNVFLEASPKNVKTRQEIKLALDDLRRVPTSALPLVARRAHEIITNREGFDFAVATRLMALARPEALVSVNSESAERLAQWSSFSVNSIKTSKGYEKLIKWVIESKWWSAPKPSESLEYDLWLYRGALIDALVYQGH